MKQEWKQRYALMNDDLVAGLEEGALEIIQRHWASFKKEILGYQFASLQEEIDFFKVMKPLFTSKMEYFLLLADDIKNPYLRHKRFKEEHADFYQYYTSGRTENDHEWFIQRSNMESSHDHLVSRLLALNELVHRHIFVTIEL